MTKKLTRSRRKELRSRGHLELVSRPAEAARAAEKQAEEAAASARVHEARAALASRRDEPVDAGAPDSVKKKGTGRRDLTVLLLVGLTAIAGVIYWLSQRPPPINDAGTAPSASATSATAGRRPLMVNPPARPPAPLPPPVAAPAPPPVVTPVVTPTGPATPSPAGTASPAAVPPAPAEPAKDKPSPAPAKVAPAKAAPAKPAPAKQAPAADPYG